VLSRSVHGLGWMSRGMERISDRWYCSMEWAGTIGHNQCRKSGNSWRWLIQWCKSGWNSADGRRGESRRLDRVEGCVWEGYLSLLGRGLGRGIGPLLRKRFNIFRLKWRVFVHFKRYFCLCPRQKNVKFSAWSVDLVGVEGVLLGNSEYYIIITGLISF